MVRLRMRVGRGGTRRARGGRDGRDASSGEWRHVVLASCAEVVRRCGRTRRKERRRRGRGRAGGQDATLENYKQSK